MHAAATSPVLMTADAVGGVWTYAFELARALGDFGIDVALATMGRPLNAHERSAAAAISNIELFESAYRLEWMDDVWDDVDAAAEWLLGIADNVAPAIIHLNGYCHAALLWPAPALVVGHSCVFSWFEAVRRAPPPPIWGEYRRRVARGLAAADSVTAPSGAMLAALKKHYGGFAAAPPIYNGRAAAAFPPGDKEAFVIAAGRLWDEAKNAAVLARVAPEISWPLYAAGDTAGPYGTVALDNLNLLGGLDQTALAGWLARASIFVSPARYEPFGYAPLEAALAGCALVLGDIPSLREIWSDAALFVPPDDAVALAGALNQLIGDAAERGALAARARARAATYSPQRMAEQYVSLYERMSAARGGTIEKCPAMEPMR
jgi:glycosyltransferase involved in cell wall biosynthesis